LARAELPRILSGAITRTCIYPFVWPTFSIEEKLIRWKIP
jgi:hypothetical protein